MRQTCPESRVIFNLFNVLCEVCFSCRTYELDDGVRCIVQLVLMNDELESQFSWDRTLGGVLFLYGRFVCNRLLRHILEDTEYHMRMTMLVAALKITGQWEIAAFGLIKNSRHVASPVGLVCESNGPLRRLSNIMLSLSPFLSRRTITNCLPKIQL